MTDSKALMDKLEEELVAEFPNYCADRHAQLCRVVNMIRTSSEELDRFEAMVATQICFARVSVIRALRQTSSQAQPRALPQVGDDLAPQQQGVLLDIRAPQQETLHLPLLTASQTPLPEYGCLAEYLSALQVERFHLPPLQSASLTPLPEYGCLAEYLSALQVERFHLPPLQSASLTPPHEGGNTLAEFLSAYQEEHPHLPRQTISEELMAQLEVDLIEALQNHTTDRRAQICRIVNMIRAGSAELDRFEALVEPQICFSRVSLTRVMQQTTSQTQPRALLQDGDGLAPQQQGVLLGIRAPQEEILFLPLLTASQYVQGPPPQYGSLAEFLSAYQEEHPHLPQQTPSQMMDILEKDLVAAIPNYSANRHARICRIVNMIRAGSGDHDRLQALVATQICFEGMSLDSVMRQTSSQAQPRALLQDGDDLAPQQQGVLLGIRAPQEEILHLPLLTASQTPPPQHESLAEYLSAYQEEHTHLLPLQTPSQELMDKLEEDLVEALQDDSAYERDQVCSLVNMILTSSEELDRFEALVETQICFARVSVIRALRQTSSQAQTPAPQYGCLAEYLSLHGERFHLLPLQAASQPASPEVPAQVPQQQQQPPQQQQQQQQVLQDGGDLPAGQQQGELEEVIRALQEEHLYAAPLL